MDIERIFGKDEGNKERVFIDDYGTAAAKAFDHGDMILLDRWNVEELFGFARDAHNDCAGGALIDDEKISLIGTEERLFQLQLLEDRSVFKMDQVDARANR